MIVKNKSFFEFFRYLLCGGIGVVVDLIIFLFFLELGVWYQYSNGIGYLAGTFASFFLNRIFTFSNSSKILKRFASFLFVASLGFATSIFMLWLLVDSLMINAQLAKILTLPIVIFIQYILNKNITFNNKVI
jgi:putative flippase GtrA